MSLISFLTLLENPAVCLSRLLQHQACRPFLPSSTFPTPLTGRRVVSASLHNLTWPCFGLGQPPQLPPYLLCPFDFSARLTTGWGSSRSPTSGFIRVVSRPPCILHANFAMASNNYYGNTHSYDFNESLRPGSSLPPSNTTSRNDLDSIYNKYSTPSLHRSLTPTPSYESTDRQQQHGYVESDNGSVQTMDQYADNIPLKSSKKSRLRTDWRNETSEYPPSPESQRDPGIGLVPHPTPMTKKGWLKGKIPWVVYIVSTVQIAVFIAEIVKNCTCTYLRYGDV